MTALYSFLVILPMFLFIRWAERQAIKDKQNDLYNDQNWFK